MIFFLIIFYWSARDGHSANILQLLAGYGELLLIQNISPILIG